MANTNNIQDQLPVIPACFMRPPGWQTILYLLYGLCLYWIPGWGACEISGMALPLLVKAALIATATIIAGHGLFMLGVTGHEGFHFTLHENRFVSAATGIFFSSAVPLFCAVGFFINHWHHHRYTNTEADPDCASLRQFKSPLARLLRTRMHVNRKYLRTTLAVAFTSTSPTQRILGFPSSQLRKLAIFNLATQCLWLSTYGFLIWSFPGQMLFIVVLPALATYAISGMNPYQEHAGTNTEPWGQARSRVSWIHTFLMGGTNYHLAHHLFPRVPCWRLPRLHRWLMEQNYVAGTETFTDASFLGSYKAVQLPYEFNNHNQ